MPCLSWLFLPFARPQGGRLVTAVGLSHTKWHRRVLSQVTGGLLVRKMWVSKAM